MGEDSVEAPAEGFCGKPCGMFSRQNSRNIPPGPLTHEKQLLLRFTGKPADRNGIFTAHPSFSSASYTRRISPTLQAWAKQPFEETGFSPS